MPIDGAASVRLDADLSESRRSRLKLAEFSLTGGLFGAGALTALGVLAPCRFSTEGLQPFH